MLTFIFKVINLQENFPNIEIKQELFLEILSRINMPKSAETYEIKTDQNQLIQKTKMYSYLSLKTIINNYQLKEEPLSFQKKFFQFLPLQQRKENPFYTKLKENNELVNLIKKCSEPFSILAEFKTYDVGSPNEVLYILTKPILGIPGATNKSVVEKIRQWEEDTLTYEIEGGLTRFGFPIRISKEEYDKRF